MTELTFTKDTDGFYTSAFRANGRCHVQINKDVSDDAGVTVFEAAVDGEDYVVFQPTYDSSGILAEIDLPSGFNVRIKSTTQVQYASVIGDAEYIPFIDQTWLYFTMPEGGTVTLTKNGTPTAVTLEYSLDNGNTWTEWVESENVRSLTLAAGQTMHVRNTSETSTMFSTSTSSYYNFAFTADTYAGGNTNSLLCKNTANAIITPYCYNSLYENCITLMTASLLPSENIAYGCYRFTFKGCTHLTLTEDFVLPATILKGLCYGGMFQNCHALTLPSNFVLYATQLEANCYNTMFSNCSNVNSIKTLMIDISAANSIYRWTEYVAQTGDFYCPAELTIPEGISGIPSGWTRHDI